MIKYDASALSFISGAPGDILTACGFEYFTTRFGAVGNCDGSCPSGLLRIVLRGLSREEVRSYIRAKAHVDPGRELLDRIYEETEGNAFFLSEVVNLLAQEGTLDKDSVSDIAIPDGVREAMGRRLNRLSQEANDLLQTSAVIGREFAYDVLLAMSRADEDRLLALLEEGLEARVIEEPGRPGQYRFTHAQVQETLLAELSATRRVRLHGQVGEALERLLGQRADEVPARLARHFIEAATLAPRFLERAIHYSELAGQKAMNQAAFADAARHWIACMSKKHPIIAITGSSGSGTTTVKHAFEHLFLRLNIKLVIVEGDKVTIGYGGT